VADVDGNRLIDFARGIGALNVGSTPIEVVEAVREQAGRSLHTAFQAVPHPGYVELA
jgi:4-aminobutyrate aminotransferase/(S)-3-amino-2-methylpropionate transaminase